MSNGLGKTWAFEYNNKKFYEFNKEKIIKYKPTELPEDVCDNFKCNVKLGHTNNIFYQNSSIWEAQIVN